MEPVSIEPTAQLFVQCLIPCSLWAAFQRDRPGVAVSQGGSMEHPIDLGTAQEAGIHEMFAQYASQPLVSKPAPMADSFTLRKAGRWQQADMRVGYQVVYR